MTHSNAKYEANIRIESRSPKRSFYVNVLEEQEDFHIPRYQEFDYLFPQPEYADGEPGRLMRA